MSARRDDETYEQYRARLLAEQKLARFRARPLVVTTAMNRENRRAAEKLIPADHAIVLAKISEMAGDELPLPALEMLYLREDPKERDTMISRFLETIEEANTTPKEKIDG